MSVMQQLDNELSISYLRMKDVSSQGGFKAFNFAELLDMRWESIVDYCSIVIDRKAMSFIGYSQSVTHCKTCITCKLIWQDTVVNNWYQLID